MGQARLPTKPVMSYVRFTPKAVTFSGPKEMSAKGQKRTKRISPKPTNLFASFLNDQIWLAIPGALHSGTRLGIS